MCSQGQDPSSRPAGVWSPGDHSARLLAQPAGLPVPVPGVPGWFQGVWGWRGAALGRTLCLEADGKGKSRCHLLSDQETQVSFPSARAGAWAAPQQAGGAAAGCGTSKTFGQGLGRWESCCLVCPLLRGSCQPVRASPGCGTRCSRSPSAASSPVPAPSAIQSLALAGASPVAFLHPFTAVWRDPRSRLAQLESRAPDEVMRDGAFSPAR